MCSFPTYHKVEVLLYKSSLKLNDYENGTVKGWTENKSFKVHFNNNNDSV